MFSYNKYIMANTNNANQYTESNSIILDLESLRVNYNNLLTEYRQAVTDYVTYLKVDISNSTYNSSQKPLEIVNGYVYSGTSTISQIKVATVQECRASCSTTTGCTGATFNNNSNAQQTNCSLRSGNSVLTPSSSNDSAIVSRGKQLLLNIENLNTQLQTINTDIRRKNQTVEPLYSQQKTKRTNNSKELTDQFNILTEERNKIKKLMQEYTTLDQKQEHGNIKITQNYGSFLLLFAIAILIIIFLIWSSTSSSVTPQTNVPIFQRGGELKSTTYYFIFSLFLFTWFILRMNHIMKGHDKLF
jgi:hypothetical protein